MLMLRSYYKAGRAQDIAKLSYTPSVREAA